MFNPRKEVPSLELCKKLKEISYPQDKYGFYWVRLKGSLVNENEWDLIYWDEEYIRWDERGKYILLGGCDCCADYLDIIEKIKAPTVRELIEILPDKIEFDKKDYYLCMTKDCIGYNRIIVGDLGAIDMFCNEKDIANRIAKALIWLAENGYVNFSKNKLN